MNCESARSQLSLLLYGELSFDGEEELERHLSACAGCRDALVREKAIHAAADSAALEPPAELLARCRAGLRSEIASAGARRGAGFFAGLAARFLRPAAAVALVAVGFVAARLVGEPAASRVRFVEPDASGRVRIVVEEARQKIVSGWPEEEGIRRLLLAAARDPSDAGLRVESMDILKSRCESAEVRRALMFALQHDSNPAVRLKALEGLRPFCAQPETRQALAQVLLTDDNPGLRAQAVDLLVQQRAQDVVGVLQRLLEKEDNGYVRLRSQRALREMNASVETF